jgi:hypothetical protein
LEGKRVWEINTRLSWKDFLRPLADRSGRCAVGEFLMNGIRHSSVLSDRLSSVNYLNLTLDRSFKLGYDIK